MDIEAIFGLVLLTGLVSGAIALGKARWVAGALGILGGVAPYVIIGIGETACRDGGEYCGWGILAALVYAAPFILAFLLAGIVGACRRSQREMWPPPAARSVPRHHGPPSRA